MLLDVFADRPFQGNPLAVFPRTPSLPTDRMQTIATELNLSETVFVLPPTRPEATHRLRIFTPRMELPFAGHPTVGAAAVLAHDRATRVQTELLLEEQVGVVTTRVTAEGGRVRAVLTSPRLPAAGPVPPDPDALAEVLSLERADLLVGPGHEPETHSCGVPFVFVPVRDESALDRVRLNMGAWSTHLEGFAAPHVYVFVPPGEDRQLSARMFAPAMGIPEDPATGAAAAALPGYLFPRDAGVDATLEWTVRQGGHMGRPSRIDVTVEREDARITAVHVGGPVAWVGRGTLDPEVLEPVASP